MFSTSYMQDIYAALEDGKFSLPDFLVEAKKDGQRMRLDIAFLLQREYAFSVRVGYNDQINVSASPGAFFVNERRTVGGWAEIPDVIGEWVESIYREMRACIPALDEIEQLRALLEEQIAANVKDPDSKFSSAEVTELTAKLDEAIQAIASMQEQLSLSDREIQRLTKELNELKDELPLFKKGPWYRRAGSKIWSMTQSMAKSPEARKIATDVARKAIGLDA